MAGRKKIGLSDVRALETGSIIWDTAVAGFGARRQRNSIAYVLKYRTMDGRQRWYNWPPWCALDARYSP
jgi:hypothetical protein